MRIKKIIEALCYVLKMLGEADKIKLVKLLYLADKYHLIRYGRTVTGDVFYALENGPIGSSTLDVLNDNPNLEDNDRNYLHSLLQQKGAYDFLPGVDCKSCEFEMLSDTDREALNFINNQYGQMSQWDIVKMLHEYPEWKQYEDDFNSGYTKRAHIKTEELLSTLDDDCLAMPLEHIEESRRILSGMYD